MSRKTLTGATALLATAFAVGCNMSSPKPSTGGSSDSGSSKPDDSGSSKPAGGDSSGGGSSGGDDKAAKAAQQDAMDKAMLGNMQVMSPMMNWPKDPSGLKKGFWIQTKTSASGMDMLTKYSIVDDAGDMLKIEATVPMQPYIQALVVKKKDGTITDAKAGRPGGALTPIKIATAPAPTGGTAPATTDESITVKAGTFKCKKSTVNGYTGWVGTEGDSNGVSVQTDDGKGNKNELTALTVEDWSCGTLKAKAKHCVYSDKSEWWWITDPIPFVGGGPSWVKMVTPSATMTVDGCGNDAAAQLKWQ
jgi:hypothetical protein